MKTNRAHSIRRRHDLLREFFACAIVIAAIKSSQPLTATSAKGPGTLSPSGRA